jgi:hypothetical protein
VSNVAPFRKPEVVRRFAQTFGYPRVNDAIRMLAYDERQVERFVRAVERSRALLETGRFLEGGLYAIRPIEYVVEGKMFAAELVAEAFELMPARLGVITEREEDCQPAWSYYPVCPADSRERCVDLVREAGGVVVEDGVLVE